MQAEMQHLLRAGGQAADVDASCGSRRLCVEHLIPRLHLGRPGPVVRQRACGKHHIRLVLVLLLKDRKSTRP
jgi:hypothetical protein